MRRIVLIVLVVVALLISLGIFGYYRVLHSSNVILGRSEGKYLLIPTGSDFEDVKKLLQKDQRLEHPRTFDWAARLMQYKDNVKPGRYLLTSGMSNRDFIILLRSGEQTPVSLVITPTRTLKQLAAKVGIMLEADSTDFMKLFQDDSLIQSLGFNYNTLPGMFIPNTYEIYWNSSASTFLIKMKAEYEAFWNATRKREASEIGLTPKEVSTLASIVEQETSRNDEKILIAGAYMNRLKKKMKLDADPTLIFALGDFKIRRVLNEHKLINSPYNTYIHEGLPPGPICIPSIASIDAVLHYARHSYIYFCAREDFSGYHNFASDYAQHMVNARKFQKALDKRKILH